MTLPELFVYAKQFKDYADFENFIKSKITGTPQTAVIEGEIVIGLKKGNEINFKL